MNEDVTQVQQNVPPPQPPAAPEPERVIDPREYDVLQRQLADAQATFAALQPHADRIRRLVEDPTASTLFDDALDAYKRVQEKQGPKIDPTVAPVYEKVSRLEKFVDDLESRQKAEAERPQREFMQHYTAWTNDASNNRFFERLMVDHKLEPHDLRWLAQVATNNNFEPLEETWKKESWRFVRGASATPPPTSLRAEAGDGTAGAPSGPQGTMRDRIIELERARTGVAR